MIISFKEYYKKNQNLVSFDITEYREILSDYIDEFIIQSSAKERANLLIMELANKIENILSIIDYPEKTKFIISMNTGNTSKIMEEQRRLAKWGEKGNKKIQNMCELIDKEYLPNIYKEIWCENTNFKDKSLKIQEVIAELTKNNMIEYANRIEEAVGRIKGWKKQPIVIKVAIPENKEDLLQPIDKFIVKIMDDKDYERLMEEVKNPPKKFITLYGAREPEDRNFYEQTRKEFCVMGESNIPPGHFYDSAEFIADNMDIWKFKIENKYLLKEGEQYYTNKITPIKWIEFYRRVCEK